MNNLYKQTWSGGGGLFCFYKDFRVGKKGLVF